MTIRFIFITGGVSSSLGKGLSSASLSSLLQQQGYKVRLKKMDGYLNVDPGTMSPLQHGEVFVTDDGTETDLDLGHYERFTSVNARNSDSTTMGKIYSSLITKERNGKFDGATVQVIPHVTDEIKEFILSDIQNEDFVLCEIGGTVGDIENLPFLEAVRQLRLELGPQRTMFIHLALVPYLEYAQEIKTKPAQKSVKELLGFGIQPDLLLCRSAHCLDQALKTKLGLFCNIAQDRIISAIDVQTIYQVPIEYQKEGLDKQVCSYFNLPFNVLPNNPWDGIVQKILHPKKQVNIAIVGKYTKLPDAYKSLIESLNHGAVANDSMVNIVWIDALDKKYQDKTILNSELREVDGILVPGGFGENGSDIKMQAVTFAREHNVPFLGICFGMQLTVIEAAKNLLNLKDASTTEFGPTADPVVYLLTKWTKESKIEERDENSQLGGTMRLGSYPCLIKQDSLAHKIYGQDIIYERHRHRYEINKDYKDKLEKVGLVFSGFSPDLLLPEIVEYVDHKWFVAVQFHPEFTSKPLNAHPLFQSFIKAAIK
jgi:CTP synthase